MKHANIIAFVVAFIHWNRICYAADAAFNKLYEEKLCRNEPTCNLTLTPGLSATRLTLHSRDCMCDLECTEYNDCCRDSEYYKGPGLSNNPKTYICLPQFKVYALASCPSTYEQTTVKHKCGKALQPLDEFDTSVITPVTNKKKRITYANVYCALCNGDADVDRWSLAAACGDVPEKSSADPANIDYTKYNRKLSEILPSLRFDAANKKFFATYKGKELTCELGASMPPNFGSFTRKCWPNMVAECPAADPQGTKKCQSYISIVYDSTKKPYRNRECALCNGVPADQLTGCPQSVRTGGTTLFAVGSKSVGSDVCSNKEIAETLKFC